MEEIANQGKLCLVGKLLADCIVSKEIIKFALVRGWKITRSASFRVLGENLFIIEFANYTYIVS